MIRALVRAVRAFAVSMPLVTTAALAGTPSVYQPLDLGWEWTYSNGKAETTISIERSRTILGVPTTTRRLSTPTETAQTYWTTDGEGDLYLHGSENLTSAFFAAYDPPLLWLDLPLSAGKTWTRTVGVCGAGESPPCPFSATYMFTIVAQTTVTVAAGTFDAFQLQVESLPPVPARAFDGTLHRASVGGGVLQVEEWVSAGTGIVQYRHIPTGTIFELTAFTGPTPTRETTWSRIKASFGR